MISPVAVSGISIRISSAKDPPTAINQFSEKYEASPSDSSLYAVIILDSS